MAVSIREHINALSDGELRAMLRRDYLRRLIQYQTTVEAMRQKYGMNYEEFVGRNIIAEKNFSWEVESNSHD